MGKWSINPLLIFGIIVLIYVLAIPVDIMEIDSAQYASIAQEMILRNDYLHVYDRGTEYLDKPPFIFWITALFSNLFGAGTFAFKFPSILFSCLGIYATYRFTRLFYEKNTAILAGLILATTQGYFHFNNDVRTDTYLTNSVITSVWLLSEWIKNNKFYWFVLGFIMIGIAMLSKGPLGLIIPAIAIESDLIIKKQWNKIFDWRLIIGILIVFVTIFPMLIGLYQQFDAHPEKVVNGKKAVSGLRFFFWEQSFGRITGENVWKNDAGPFFFVPNIAWSFMPWTIPLFLSVFSELFSLFKRGLVYFTDKIEWVSLSGLIIPFIALSQSQYKLPHYIYVVFPFAAILTAVYIRRLEISNKNFHITIINYIQSFILILVWILAGVVFIWFFPIENSLLILFSVFSLITFIYIFIKANKSSIKYFISISLLTVLSLNILIASKFYPSLLNYQAGGKIADEINVRKIDTHKIFVHNISARSIDVKTHSVISSLSLNEIKERVRTGQITYVATDYKGLQDFNDYKYKIITSKQNHAVTLITLPFLIPKTRDNTLVSFYLIKIGK
jgi:hypothetical protein